MEISRKINKDWQVNLSAQFCQELGWSKDDTVNLKIENNQIIVFKEDSQKAEETKTTDEITYKPSEPAEETTVPEKKLNIYKMSSIKCIKCGKPIGESRLRYNQGYLCESCKNALKQRLINDIKKKRGEE